MSVHLSINESSPCIFVDILNNQQQNFQQSFGKKAEEKQHLFKLIPIRFIILAISLFCLSLLIANPLALNFTVICMNKEQQLLVISDDELMFSQNSTLNEKDSKEEILEPLFTSDEQSWLFSAIAIGQFIGTIPITKIYINFGLRKLLFVYGLLSSFSTLLVAPSIYFGGFPALMILRVFQGAGMSSIWVATGAISSTWAPLSNSGIFLAVLTCCFQFGPIISMPLSAEFCSSEMLGWPSVFYLLGIISLILFIIFYWIYRDSPRQFRLLTGRELLLIEKGKNSIQDGRKKCQTKQEIPYISILKDKVFWGVYVCGITSNMAFQVFWQYGPIYLNKALGMEVAKTGVAAALPFVLSAIGKNCAGQISDRLTSISEKSKVIAFASISQYLMGICFLAMALFPKFGIINVTLMQSIFTAATVFSGFNTVGLIKGAQLMSSQFSHVVFYWLTYQLSAIMLLLPMIVNFFTPTNAVEEWADFFLLVTACIFIGTTFFNYVIEVEPREWTKIGIQKIKPSLSTTTLNAQTICVEEGKKIGLDILQIR
ncbi:MFS domain-containing protein [Meloidogyne graminicola]|uniref:MFS domain-containing protein n=1 Tax=Meloidogyne graminicola TaxID=189291 RepID=A0A8S9ZNP0_9BILA|nr:MFS domain-containing protein [Meloidogyne graminicola]